MNAAAARAAEQEHRHALGADPRRPAPGALGAAVAAADAARRPAPTTAPQEPAGARRSPRAGLLLTFGATAAVAAVTAATTHALGAVLGAW